MNIRKYIATAMAAGALYATPGSAMVFDATAGPGGFDNGFATAIAFDTAAARGSSLGRNNPLNALGAPDGNPSAGSAGVDNTFFEIGLGSTIELTFGTLFDTSVSVFEITLGSRAAHPESAEVFVGMEGDDGSFIKIADITNSSTEIASVILSTLGVFDAVRITDTSSAVGSASVGGFDVDAVRVQPIPLPASVLLLLTAVGGLGLFRRYAPVKTTA